MEEDYVSFETEGYVSFEVAKLLKEKGFDESTIMRYESNGEISTDGRYGHYNSLKKFDFISAPTLQMAMKWLRKNHSLSVYARAVWGDVEIQYGNWEEAVIGYDWFIESLSYNDHTKTNTGEPFRTYEEACEAGIKYCLENLI